MTGRSLPGRFVHGRSRWCRGSRLLRGELQGQCQEQDKTRRCQIIFYGVHANVMVARRVLPGTMIFRRTIFTLGHSTLPIEAFLSVLGENHVRRLIDVRSIPRSRHNPQYEQQSLSESLAQAKMEYHWMPELGGLRPALRDSINTGWRNSSFRGYADYMQTEEFAAALDQLIREAAVEQTCVLCSEAVPWRCHRSLVADGLTAREVPVEHIMYHAKATSKRTPHRLTTFAKVEGSRVWYPPEDDLFSAPPAAGE